MNEIIITALSDSEIARLEVALAAQQADQNADSQARGGVPIELALDDIAYFFLMQGLIAWEERQATAAARRLPQ